LIKKNYSLKFLYGLFVAIILTLISILLFRGRLGSDDLEVFNFVYSYYNSDFGSIKEYINNIEISKLYIDDIQKHSPMTFSHRFVWVLQTMVIYKFVSIFLDLKSANSIFINQYFCGLIITIYSVLSFYFFYLILKKKNIKSNSSLILSFFLFCGTGLISFFTGAYIESLVVLLFVLRYFYKNFLIIFLIDLIILFIKPYYYIVIFFLKLSDYFFIKKKLNLILKYLFSLFLLILFYRFLLTDPQNNLESLNNKGISFNLFELLKNFVNFYISFGIGIFFTSTIPVVLIFLGKIKNVTIIKIVGIIFFSIFLSLFDGFHGQAPGGRYFLPTLFIFLDEIIIGYKKIINIKKKYHFFILCLFALLTIFNLPTLEYRNTSLPEYLNATAFKQKPASPVFLNKNNEYQLFPFPIKDIEYNNIIFSSKIFIYKILDERNIYIANYKINSDNIYPATGIGRLIYLKENNLNIYNPIIINFAKKFYFLLKIIYIVFFLIIFLIIFLFFLNLLKKNLWKKSV
jgi:hypothetical protein